MTILINAYATLSDPPDLKFNHKLNARRDLNDKELPKHLRGFINYMVAQNGGEMTQMLYHVIQHVKRVQHHISVNVEEKNMSQFTQWATDANAIAFMPDGTVRDPSLNVLVYPGGVSPDDNATVPYPADALERKTRMQKELERNDVRVAASLPPVISAREVILRSSADVASRMLALFAVAVRAESLATNSEIPVAELQEKMPLAFDSLTKNERKFLDSESPDQQDIVNFAWRYEALFLLQWALGLFDSLPFPSTICDVPAVAKVSFSSNSEDFIRNAKLLPVDQILDTLDFHFRLHWATRQAGLDKTQPPANLDGGVVQERCHALNWLVRFENKDWDIVDTPT